ncbi:MAG: sulfatase [Planctomycetes bacterium]|nr:sulfatase [Planctomycetota bacterium]
MMPHTAAIANCLLGSALLIAVPAVLPAADAPRAASRPNVLLISVDDLRPSLGCYGDTLVQSPNIDRLARSSRLFQHAYIQQAVCGPSRASLLTGRLPDNIRVWHNRHLFRDTLPDAVTLPQLFKNNGYHTQGLGKVFSGREREEDPQSWSVPSMPRGDGWRNYALPENNKRTGKAAAFEAADVDDDGYPDGKLTDLAIETLTRLHGQPQPFFLAVGFLKPHLPFNAPKKYWDLYDPAQFDFPELPAPIDGAPEIAYHTHRELGGYQDIPDDERVSADQSRMLRHGYHACVSYIDAQVGRLLQTLERLGLQDHTIVVLWGDHGFALGEEDRWCKGTNFDLDTRVPLLVRTPNMAQPGVPTEALVEAVDIYPTLAALAGLTPPAGLDGVNFAPVLEDPAARTRDCALSQFSRPWRRKGQDVMGYSIRTPTHRYTRWVRWPSRKTTAEELYDYTLPGSALCGGSLLVARQNVLDQPTHAGIRDQLRTKMDDVLRTRLDSSRQP